MNKGIKLKNSMIYERGTVSRSGLLQHNLRLGAVRHEGPCTPNSEAWNFCYSDGESLSDLHQGVTWLNLCVRNTPGGCVQDELNRYKTRGKETNKLLLRAHIGAVVEGGMVIGPDRIHIYRGKLARLNGNGFEEREAIRQFQVYQ